MNPDNRQQKSDEITKLDQPEPQLTGWAGFKDWFDDFFDLREGMDREQAIYRIKSSKLMRGSNAWMLVCSIMIASLGLNLNSGAVIIGAMLISPLMSPILGIGLGVGTNDRDTLRASVLHFGIAIMIALITSTLYFFLTPIDQFTDEMDARTAPNLLDGMVALFGGLAGIISVTLADQTNAIPGVAIATALMPPLCVCGYGIAAGEWAIAARSFYLFFLNSFFIATTAYVIIRVLRFPYRRYLDKASARRSRFLILLFSILIIIPGIFILREVLSKTRVKRGVQQFVEQYFPTDCAEYNIISQGGDSSVLVLQLTRNSFSQDSVVHYNRILSEPPFEIANMSILPYLNPLGNLERLDQLNTEVANLDQVRIDLAALRTSWEEQQAELEDLETQMQRFSVDSSTLHQISAKAKLAFPRLQTISLGQVQRSDLDELALELDHLPMVVISRSASGRFTERRSELERMEDYFKLELGVDTLMLIDR
ncbi:MAG: DUF389 domain-containing protein [Bacteroidota bacterium]